jgi:hypothetical protein
VVSGASSRLHVAVGSLARLDPRRCQVRRDELEDVLLKFAPTEYRDMQGSFVVRGEATAQNPNGVPITHRYVCMVLPDSGRVQAWLRGSNRAMYDEVVRLAGF